MEDKFQSVRGIIVKDNKVLLMHRKKDGEEYWVFPGGHTEEGETPEETLKREIWEEVSLNITRIGKIHPFRHQNGIECFFECEVEEGEPKIHTSGNKKNTDNDWYNPEWVELSKAKKLENLYPQPITLKFLELYENK